MDYDYTKRGYLLPEGCKDLIDVFHQKMAVTERGFEVTVPGAAFGNLELTAEVGEARIIGKRLDGSPLFTVPVPAGYDLTRARATYINGELHILVPKATA
jgi:HSP20 family molecular chaperone IbpA